MSIRPFDDRTLLQAEFFSAQIECRAYNILERTREASSRLVTGCAHALLSLWISSSAASAITVPGGKMASAPAA